MEGMSLLEQGKMKASFPVLEAGNFQLLHIKQLRGDIKELKIKNHRFIFFIHAADIYFISAFIKKTNKTPLREIENALKIYKEIIKLL